MKKLLILIIVNCCALVVTGCSIYRIDIQQGNIIDQDDLNQVSLGMTQHQVRYILGTPIVQDPFHKDRWDYLYSLKKGKKKAVTKNVTLHFDKKKLVKIEGTMQPDPKAKKDLSQINKQTIVTVTPQPKKKPSLWRRIFLGTTEEDN
jgi:outer membrane protein assembly factor BamE